MNYGPLDLFIDKKFIKLFEVTNFCNNNEYAINGNYSMRFEDIMYDPNNKPAIKELNSIF